MLFLWKKQRQALKRQKRRVLYRKRRNRSLQGKPYRVQESLKGYRKAKRIKAPENLSFLENTNEVAGFVHELSTSLKNRQPVFVDLSEVASLDYGAITVLLSVMYRFKTTKIPFNGNFPIRDDIKFKLVDSQFFRRLEENIFTEPAYLIQKANQIFAKATNKVVPQLGQRVVEEASQTIWGKKRACKGIPRLLVEIMQNTHNHAIRGSKGGAYWWLSVNHDTVNKKVSFVFVDYGQGIFESLYSKWPLLSSFKKKVLGPDNATLLKKLLEGEVQKTVTGQYFRGKGLPNIMKVLKRNQISNLHIISNDVFADVAKDEYSTLEKSFKGTFFHWELCENNENELWTIS